MDSDWLSYVLLSDCQDDYDSWSSLFASDNDEDDTSLRATVPRGSNLGKELYAGAMLSAQDFSLGLLAIIQKHNLTYSCVNGIL